MTEDPIAKAIVDKAMALYHPGSRPHANEWTVQPNGKRFLGVSTLVQSTAAEYATHVINRVEEVDETGGFYSEQGNTLAEAHLSKLTPFRENQLRIPIGDYSTWEIVGHADGIVVIDASGNIVTDPDECCNIDVAEHKHKDYANPEEGGGPVDLAERQASLYLTMLELMIVDGVQPTLADFAPPGAMALHINPHSIPKLWGISTHFWPRNDPRALVRARPLDELTRASISDFYLDKAHAVLKSILAAEERGLPLAEALAIPGGAKDWDLSIDGLQEFKRTMAAIDAGIDNFELAAVAMAHDVARLQVSKWEAIKSEQSAIGVALLKRSGQKSLTFTAPDGREGKATAVNNSGGSQHMKVTMYGNPKPSTKPVTEANGSTDGNLGILLESPSVLETSQVQENQDGGAT